MEPGDAGPGRKPDHSARRPPGMGTGRVPRSASCTAAGKAGTAVRSMPCVRGGTGLRCLGEAAASLADDQRIARSGRFVKSDKPLDLATGPNPPLPVPSGRSLTLGRARSLLRPRGFPGPSPARPPPGHRHAGETGARSPVRVTLAPGLARQGAARADGPARARTGLMIGPNERTGARGGKGGHSGVWRGRGGWAWTVPRAASVSGCPDGTGGAARGVGLAQVSAGRAARVAGLVQTGVGGATHAAGPERAYPGRAGRWRGRSSPE